MTNYRRNFIAGGSFFFTVNLAERRLRLLTEHIDELRKAFRETRRDHPFTIDAMVILPNHLHTIWTMPEGDANFATRWRLIKSAFSRSLPTGERISDSRVAKGERGIWQRRYWEHTIRDESDFNAAVAKLREIAKAAAADSRVVIQPVLISVSHVQQEIADSLAGLDFEMSKSGVSGHPLTLEWIREQALAAAG